MRVLLRDHLDKLHYFNTIAQLGSLRKAAEQLRVSQPSLTHAIKVLEDATGTKLFHRSTKGVILTASGETLLLFSRRVFTDLDALEG